MLGGDLGYALRTLGRARAFTATAIITIAFGIGASTAVFSVANGVLLRPLPYKDPDRLVFVSDDRRARDQKDNPFSNANFLDLRNGTEQTFEDLAVVTTAHSFGQSQDGTLQQVPVATVTPNFLRLMGAHIELGRHFVESDGPLTQPKGSASGTTAESRPQLMAILSYEYWQRRYGGSSSVLGKGTFNGPGAPQIVGVLAPGFELLFPPRLNLERRPDIWFATRLSYDSSSRDVLRAGRVIGRLRKGITLEQAQAQADAVAADIRRQFLIPATSGFHIRLEPMKQYIAAEARPAILAVVGGGIFLLLISCANLANLLLVRVSLRERELAVRNAVGASRWRLARQIFVEALVLVGIGTVLGLGIAWGGVRVLLVTAPANLPRLDSIRLDSAVLAFSVTAGVLAVVGFGMVPAWRASRLNPQQLLHGGGRSSGTGRSSFLRSGVVIAEVMLSFVLLIGAGLMFRSFLALQRIDPGYDPSNLLTFTTSFAGYGSQPQERAALMNELRRQLSAIPGVRSVTAASPFPLADRVLPWGWGPLEALADPNKFQGADCQAVMPGYFETLRIPA